MRLHLDTVQLPTKTQLPYLFDQSLSNVKAEGVNAKCLEKKKPLHCPAKDFSGQPPDIK